MAHMANRLYASSSSSDCPFEAVGPQPASKVHSEPSTLGGSMLGIARVPI